MWILKLGCPAVSLGKHGTAKMPGELRRWGAGTKNCVCVRKIYNNVSFRSRGVGDQSGARVVSRQSAESTRHAGLGASHSDGGFRIEKLPYISSVEEVRRIKAQNISKRCVNRSSSLTLTSLSLSRNHLHSAKFHRLR